MENSPLTIFHSFDKHGESCRVPGWAQTTGTGSLNNGSACCGETVALKVKRHGAEAGWGESGHLKKTFSVDHSLWAHKVLTVRVKLHKY